MSTFDITDDKMQALIERSKQLWKDDTYLQQQWVNAVLRLGNKWLLAMHVERKADAKRT